MSIEGFPDDDGFLVAQLEQKIKELLAPINPDLAQQVISDEGNIEKALMSLLVSPIGGNEKARELVRLRKNLIEARADRVLGGT